MKDIKEFARNLIIPTLIGIVIGIFIAKVVGSTFDLWRLEIIITAVVLASSACVISSLIKARKKK